MKIARLFAQLIYLMNRDIVSARTLAEQFEVSVRTIQRDMDTLALAGMPVTAVRGPRGGYCIMKEYKLHRQLINTADLFFILTSLESISATLDNKQMSQTLEKVRALVGHYQQTEITTQQQQLQIDFSAMHPGPNREAVFSALQRGIESGRLIQFRYIDGRFQETQRTVEPMTLTFRWFSWYLFGFCRLRNDYRLFRLSRMRNIHLTHTPFKRHSKSVEQFMAAGQAALHRDTPEIKLKFHPSLKNNVEDYWQEGRREISPDGYLLVSVRLPENEWLYGMILSYGDGVEVLAPAHLRKIIHQKSLAVASIYKKK